MDRLLDVKKRQQVVLLVGPPLEELREGYLLITINVHMLEDLGDFLGGRLGGERLAESIELFARERTVFISVNRLKLLA